MKLRKTAGLVTLACGLVALAATNASAQAPTLTGSVSGTTVTIQWTGVAGALGYTLQAGSSPGSSNIAAVNLPANITSVVVNAPAGTYYLRVRATAGTITGPDSNEVVVTVGAPPPPGPCTPPVAPTLTASVQGGTVTLTWTATAGAQGYRVEFSRAPGGLELALIQSASTTSLQRYVGMLGVFYARVVVGTACGNATSAEVSFTVTSLGGGPRTPNPPPGELLPAPTYGEAIVLAVAAQHAGDLANACGSRTWLFRVVQALRQRDTRWGLNYKRGHRGDLSTDIVTYNPTDRPDEGESRVYLFDVIGAICERNYPSFADVTQATWAARGNPICGAEWCAMWTLEPYIAAGFPPDGRPQQ